MVVDSNSCSIRVAVCFSIHLLNFDSSAIVDINSRCIAVYFFVDQLNSSAIADINSRCIAVYFAIDQLDSSPVTVVDSNSRSIRGTICFSIHLWNFDCNVVTDINSRCIAVYFAIDQLNSSAIADINSRCIAVYFAIDQLDSKLWCGDNINFAQRKLFPDPIRVRVR